LPQRGQGSQSDKQGQQEQGPQRLRRNDQH